MIYLDTSFIVPLLVHESASEQITSIIQRITVNELAISSWTIVEFSSVIARKVRMREFNESVAIETIKLFQQEIVAICQIILPTVNDCDLARHFIEDFRTGLRAGDALPLAIAKNRDLPIYTLNLGLAKAANLLNIQVVLNK